MIRRTPIKTKYVGKGFTADGEGLNLLLEQPDLSHPFTHDVRRCKPHQFYHIGIIHDLDSNGKELRSYIGISQCTRCSLIENSYIDADNDYVYKVCCVFRHMPQLND